MISSAGKWISSKNIEKIQLRQGGFHDFWMNQRRRCRRWAILQIVAVVLEVETLKFHSSPRRVKA